jgi:hypothetical protein
MINKSKKNKRLKKNNKIKMELFKKKKIRKIGQDFVKQENLNHL